MCRCFVLGCRRAEFGGALFRVGESSGARASQGLVALQLQFGCASLPFPLPSRRGRQFERGPARVPHHERWPNGLHGGTAAVIRLCLLAFTRSARQALTPVSADAHRRYCDVQVVFTLHTYGD